MPPYYMPITSHPEDGLPSTRQDYIMPMERIEVDTATIGEDNMVDGVEGDAAVKEDVNYLEMRFRAPISSLEADRQMLAQGYSIGQKDGVLFETPRKRS